MFFHEHRISKNTTIITLLILLSLFCFRVAAQWVQFIDTVTFLPAFETWHSATLPYAWLLVSQLIIILVVGSAIYRIYTNQYAFRRDRAMALLVIGSVYFAFMLVRFVLSITLLPDHHWFGATLPAFFHLVLSDILIIVGWYELSSLERKWR